MGLKVVKFGGSSLADAGQLKKVRDIVMSDGDRRFVVPSAPGKRFPEDIKITDSLYKANALALEGRDISPVFDRIEERFLDIAARLGLSVDVKKHLDKVRADIVAGAGAQYAASRGEYLNGLLLADYLGFEFVDPAGMILFDENGRFLSEKTNDAVASLLMDKKNAVIPGFYGSYPDGSIRTFSRGGSDITGAIVARGLNADLYENWTDVSGFLVADPRIVDSPAPIKTISYMELRELSYMGATVLHEDAIFPVSRANIPINIRNTNRPDDDGTMIVSRKPAADGTNPVTGIAGKKGFTVITISKAMMNAEVGLARRMLSALEKYEVCFEHMPTGIDTISLVVADNQIEGKKEKIIAEIMEQCRPDTIEIVEDLALIATVGHGMVSTRGTASRVFDALARENINIRMIDQGSSELNIIIGVDNENFREAVRAIYREFFLG
ncbi:MAG: aspartate kinase [Eubacteriales bacterium]|nr:aspartate kinase [Eubacteriales bacterium]